MAMTSRPRSPTTPSTYHPPSDSIGDDLVHHHSLVPSSIPHQATSASSSARPGPLRSGSSAAPSGSGSGSITSSPHFDINDTTRRVNYRPTPLPSDHIANQVGFPRTTGMYRRTGAGGGASGQPGDVSQIRCRSGSVSGSRPGRHARWLSEDEGLGGTVGVGLGRAGPSGWGSGGANGGGAENAIATGSGSGNNAPSHVRPTLTRPPSEMMHRRARGIRPEDAGSSSTMSSADREPRVIATGTKPQDRKSATARQRLRRTHSSEGPTPGLQRIPSATLTIGSASDTLEEMPAATEMIGSSGHPIAPSGGMPLPSIQDLVPPRSRLQPQIGVAAGGLRRAHASADVEGDAVALAAGSDFGSEIGISHVREVGVVIDQMSEKEQEDQRKRELVAKLVGVLGCPVCPKDFMSPHTVLRQPVTLFCGHTISASHITLPSVPHPDLTGMSTLDAEHALIAFQNSKLAAWRNVTCPIPICRMHVGNASGSGIASATFANLAALDGEEEGYLQVARPDMAVVGSQLLDVSVDKVMDLVFREQRAQAAEERIRSATASTLQPEPGLLTDDEDEGSSGHEADGESDAEDDVDPHGEHAVGSFEAGLEDASGVHGRQVHRNIAGVLTRTASKRRRTRSFHAKVDRSPPSKRAAGLMADGTQGGLPANKQAKMTFERELSTIVECDVCTLLLHDPITTPCQHTFCAKCLARSLDHSTRCPVCRQELPSFTYFQSHSVNKLMLTVILTAFPMEYAERKRGIEAEERDARLNTPIFVCTLAFPGMPTILHVFEPRYRLMLRRCVESTNPQFGMVMPARGNGSATSGLMEYGTMLEIKSIQMLPDGRSMVETMGVARFRLREKGTLDGYTVGRVDIIEDISAEDELALEQASIEQARAAAELRRTASSDMACATPSNTNSIPSESAAGPAIPAARPLPARLQSAGAIPAPIGGDPSTEHEPSTQELMAICHGFIDQLRSGSAPWLLQRLNNMYGPMPDSPADFSYWMALVMPIDEYEKARLLPIRSPRLRLRLIVHWVEQLRSSWWFSSGCVTN